MCGFLWLQNIQNEEERPDFGLDPGVCQTCDVVEPSSRDRRVRARRTWEQIQALGTISPGGFFWRNSPKNFSSTETLILFSRQTLEVHLAHLVSTPQSLGPQCRAPVILPSIGAAGVNMVKNIFSSEDEDRSDGPVFLLETSGRAVLNPRQACAAESAASR